MNENLNIDEQKCRAARSVCLLNDSFPPLIDGVANTVMNYAKVIESMGGRAVVATPDCPGADDSNCPFPIVRYPSIDARKKTGYMAGVPFSPSLAQRLQQEKTEILHSHCPAMSTVLARELRDRLNVPLIFTYHTKFDIDIADITSSKLVQWEATRLLVQNVTACDEVWVVSNGAGENLKSLGYEGDYIVMNNGVDMERGRIPEDRVREALKDYDIPEGIPVYLFVGRMMWYKGLWILLNALGRMKAQNYRFRMVFVGRGADLEEIKEYVEDLGLTEDVIFTGSISDRELLKCWYCRSDLFLFPSVYDTNGLVVREAAACSVPSVLVKGSCAAEGVTDGVNGYLIEENAASMAEKLISLYPCGDAVKQVGEGAARDLYLSWHDAVVTASERYEIVLDKYRSGGYPRKPEFSRDLYAALGTWMDRLGKAEKRISEVKDSIWNT